MGAKKTIQVRDMEKTAYEEPFERRTSLKILIHCQVQDKNEDNYNWGSAIYTPTNDTEEKECAGQAKNDLQLMMGDYNTKIGANNSRYEHVMGI